MRYCLLFFAFLAASCSHRPVVSARSEYLSPDYLASAKINTPDPGRKCFTGQQIVVNWNVVTRCLPATLLLTVRYGTGECEELEHELTLPRGFWIFRLLNEDFWEKQGILSYSVRICSDGILLGRYNHHLWAEIIEIKEPLVID